jgi:hypothetical protein
MKHILATLAIMVLLLAGCGQQVPPVPNGPQSWGKGELYTSLRNTTIKGAASGQWLAKKHEKMDYRELQKLSKAEGEALIAAGYDPWTGSFKQTPAGVTPYRVEQLAIADGLSQGKTYGANGKEIPLQCLVSQGNGLFREVVKKEKVESSSPFANLGGPRKEYIERDASPVTITACARQDSNGTWAISHVTVEKPKPAKAATEGGN